MRSIRHWSNCVSHLFRGERPRRRRRPSSFSALEALEQRVLLTNFLVTTTEDVVAADGKVSLREAVQAANSNSAVGDATAGEAGGDVIRFTESFGSDPVVLSSLGEFAITDDLIIDGASSSDPIAIQASDTRIFNINTGEDVWLIGLDLSGGNAEQGGAIAIAGGGRTTIEETSIHDCIAHAGGALSNDASTLVIRNAQLRSNRATFAFTGGGAIYNQADSRLIISNTTISDNISFQLGGGIYQEAGGGVISLRNVSLANNFAGGNGIFGDARGGGLFSDGTADVTIIDSSIVHNAAGSDVGPGAGGGIYFNAGQLVILGSLIDGNSAAIYRAGAAAGGGLLNVQGHVTIFDTAITNNEVYSVNSASGGGIRSYGGLIVASGSTIQGNMVYREGSPLTRGGGGICLSNTDLTLRGSRLIGNSAIAYLFDTNEHTISSGAGGGLDVGNGCSVRIISGEIAGNRALRGGGIGIAKGSSVRIDRATIASNSAQQGGGIYNAGALAVFDTNIRHNAVRDPSGRGGGIFAADANTHVSGSNLFGNFAMRAGGGIEIVAGRLDLVGNSLVHGNVAGIGKSAVSGEGGGLHVSAGATVAIHNSVISRNNAANEGGGIWIASASAVNLIRSFLTDNHAFAFQGGRGGGGILNNGGTLLIIDSAIARNVTTRHGGGLLLAAGSSTRIVDSRIDNNDAGRAGGGIFTNGELELEDALVRFNTARAGGGVYTGIAGSTTLENSVVSGNIPNNFAGPGQIV